MDEFACEEQSKTISREIWISNWIKAINIKKLSPKKGHSLDKNVIFWFYSVLLLHESRSMILCGKITFIAIVCLPSINSTNFSTT